MLQEHVSLANCANLFWRTLSRKIPVTYYFCGIPRMLTISVRLGCVLYLKIVKKYVIVRLEFSKSQDSCFFMCYEERRCYSQPIGKEALYVIPNKTESFLNLEQT